MIDPAARLFVYGTLMDRATLERVLGRRYGGEQLRARLPGYARRRVPGYAYPVLFPDPAAATDGLLLLDLTGEDLLALDAYEDVAEGAYERRAVEVEAWACGPTPLLVEAHTYLAGPRFR
jgi:gamma-glutamylcyclotransferase (GGCT)/AIG2-like uncharacterized protein YtfP